MARPRTHDLDQLLDVAERLVADHGPERFTVRALAAASGVSNGAIYHAFGSLPVLLGRLWLRAAREFLDLQVELVEAVRGDGHDAAVDAVVAAAGAPAVFADRRPAAARMLIAVRRDQLLGPEVPQELAEAMLSLDRQLVELLKRLARGLWGRADGPGVEVVTLCVVDLPTAVFRRALTQPPPGGRPVITADRRARLDAAVRGVLTVPPPPPAPRTDSSGDA
ncbi:TetR/AcrR family transcriptional regulator [Nonomuraea rhodomycinica]|uniref:TetR/AcrR family transcriptional regulator n=1 Tax=Nonomuraea rhodomycinica TaxID=1712872 RepID=A0A7Y6IR19_9ACTN|nr:TetR/AcrR family transcriptional regulator [Nonomuraea rhodomycinica]NUW42535.1 TetR/AcrR family transcriptional regulator [Nonomuraea rhodomycinica]